MASHLKDMPRAHGPTAGVDQMGGRKPCSLKVLWQKRVGQGDLSFGPLTHSCISACKSVCRSPKYYSLPPHESAISKQATRSKQALIHSTFILNNISDQCSPQARNGPKSALGD